MKPNTPTAAAPIMHIFFATDPVGNVTEQRHRNERQQGGGEYGKKQKATRELQRLCSVSVYVGCEDIETATRTNAERMISRGLRLITSHIGWRSTSFSVTNFVNIGVSR